VTAHEHRVLVVGAGSIGERHLRCFLASGRCRVGFVEPRAQLRGQVAERYGRAAAHETLEQALAEGYTAAVIATPAPLHIPQSRHLAQEGCHLLIEKPLSLSLEGIDSLVELITGKKLTAAVAYVQRANPVLEEMRVSIASGEMGRPVQLVAVAGQHFPFYRPAYRETYYTRHETGGGAVQDALTHIINAAQWLVGPAMRVVADAEHCVLPGVEVEDTVHVLARHESVLASYSLNQHQSPNELVITVIGERGTARFENATNSWKTMSTPGGEWSLRTSIPLERDALFTRQAEAFLDAIEGRREPLCPLADGIDAVRVNKAILKSIGSRSWCEVEEAMNVGA
jgi:predicted dehydrogenase